MAPLERSSAGGDAVVPRATAWALMLGIALCQGAWAESYVCKVGDHTYTGQIPPPECRNVDVRVLNADGSLNHVISAPLTPEQRRKLEEEQRQQALQEDLARKQRSEDRALLETYSSVDEIEAARQRDLAGRKLLIDRADARIQQYQRERKRLDDEAEFYVNHEMPRKLKEAYATNQTLTEQQQKTRADSLAEMVRINERYDAKRKRFEELEREAQEAQAARRAAEEQLR
jgi:hypothetical protein